MSIATPVMERVVTQPSVDNRTLEFSLKNRCDSCGPTAQAYHLFWHSEYENPLMFCIHHSRRYRDKLVKQGFREEDHSERLTKNGTKPDGGSAAG